jgi:O-antigen ligase
MLEFLNYIFSVGIIFSHIIGYVASILAFVFIYKNWNNIKNNKIIIFTFLFLVYGFVLACFCSYTKNAFEEMFTYLTSWFFPFILGYFIVDNYKKEKIIKIYILTFTAIIIVSLLAYFGLFYERFMGAPLALKGKLINANLWHISLGAMCVLLSSFSLNTLLFKKDLLKKEKIVLSILTVLFIVSLYLTSSRGYYIAGSITYLCMFVFYVFKTKKFILPTILFCLSFSLIALIHFNNSYMKERIQNTSVTKEWSLTNRIDSYKAAILIFKNNFVFGVGPRQAVKQDEYFMARNVSKEVEHRSRHLHSMWLAVLAEFGTIGFVLFFTMIFLVMKNLYYEYKYNNSIFALCMLFAWLSLLIGDCFDTVLRGPRVAMDYFWLTGLILAKSSNKTETK